MITEGMRETCGSVPGDLAGVVRDWSKGLKTENEQPTQALRRQTLTGRPCGSLAFVL